MEQLGSDTHCYVQLLMPRMLMTALLLHLRGEYPTDLPPRFWFWEDHHGLYWWWSGTAHYAHGEPDRLPMANRTIYAAEHENVPLLLDGLLLPGQARHVRALMVTDAGHIQTLGHYTVTQNRQGPPTFVPISDAAWRNRWDRLDNCAVRLFLPEVVLSDCDLDVNGYLWPYIWAQPP